MATPEMADRLSQQRKALSDPIRLRIPELLAVGGGCTVKQLAEDLGVEANRLYYHLRILEAADLIEVIGTTASGRMVEKIYGPKVGSFGNELPGDDPIERTIFFSSILDATKTELQDVVFEQARQTSAGDLPLKAMLVRGTLVATQSSFGEFTARFDQLLDEFNERAMSGGEPLTAFPFTFTVYQRPDRPPTEQNS